MQQVVRLEIWVPQEASSAVKSMLPVASHFSFDFAQLITAWYWPPQAAAKVFWQEVMSAEVGAVSFAQLPLSEHEASLLPQPANAIAATVIAAKKSFFISCPSKFDFGKCGHVPNSGGRLLHPGKPRKKAGARQKRNRKRRKIPASRLHAGLYSTVRAHKEPPTCRGRSAS